MGSFLRLAIVPVVAVCLIYVFRVLRVAYKSDLRKIPGPFLSRFTNLSLKYQVLTANRMYYTHALHQKYGPFVRISPTEVSVADVKANREIHKIGTSFTKSSWYQNQTRTQTSDETSGVFCVRDPKQASHRRKFFQQANTKTALLEWEPKIRSIVGETVAKIKRDALKDGKVDVMKWWVMMTTDVLGSLAFGEPFDIIKNESKNKILHDIETHMMYVGIKLELPLVFHSLNTIPIPGVEKPRAVSDRLEAHGNIAVVNSKASLKGGTKTLFSKMFPEDGQQPFSDDVMAKEAANIIVAGADTTAMTLTYLTWEVLSQPEVKAKLLKELSSCSENPSWEELEELTYLNNVIQETLRLRPAVGALPRVAPPQGATLGDYRLPGDTVALTQAYIIHRDPVVFKDPERFDPERWNEPTPEMKEAFMAFGGSARVCLGQSIARLEMLRAVSVFFRECPNSELAPGMTWDKVKPLDIFTILPKGGVVEIALKD